MASAAPSAAYVYTGQGTDLLALAGLRTRVLDRSLEGVGNGFLERLLARRLILYLVECLHRGLGRDDLDLVQQ